MDMAARPGTPIELLGDLGTRKALVIHLGVQVEGLGERLDQQ